MKRATLVLLAGLALSAAYAATQAKDDRAEVALQAAIKKETIDGDLKGAIEQYKKIAQSGNRAVAAKALVRMGQCYEKLGDAEARKAYERVLREYADQKEAADQARARLAAKGRDARSETGVMARQLGVDSVLWPQVSLSPDGRYFSYVDPETLNLEIRDLGTGEKRRLTNVGSLVDALDEVYHSAFSPDGRQIAYGWFDGKARRDEFRVMGLDGSTPRVLCPADNAQAYAWSPDGKQILGFSAKENANPQIVWVSVADGSLRVVKTLETPVWPDSLSLSPDGRYIAYDYAMRPGSSEIFLLTADGSRETPLARDPVSDRSPIWTPDGKSILFLSDRTGSTAAWKIEVSEGRPQRSPEVIKQDMGASTLIGFTPRGSLYYSSDTANSTRDLYTAVWDFATGKVAEAPERVLHRFVGSNGNGKWSPDGRYLAYLRSSPSAPYEMLLAIHIRSVETGEEREIPLKLSRPFYADYNWSPEGRSFLVVAAGADGRQGIYRVALQDGETTLVTAAKEEQWLHLPAGTPDGKRVFYWRMSTNPQLEAAIVVREMETGRERELLHASQHPMHYALSPDGRRVAVATVEGGQGTVLKILPVDGGEAREVFRLAKEQGIIPWRSLAWSPDGRFLLFGLQRKGNDFTGAADELWAIAAEGGKPRKLELPPKQALRDPDIHPDGRRVVFSGGTPYRKAIWVMENLLPELKASR